MKQKRVQHHVMRHLARHGVIGEAHERNVFGKIRVGQKSVDARAQRKDRLHIGQRLEETRRRTKAQERNRCLRLRSILTMDETVSHGA